MSRATTAASGLCLALGLGLAGAPARAEDQPVPAASATPAASPAPEPPRDRRLLNGHDFLPSVVSAPGPTYRLNGDPTGETRTYSWGGMGQAIRFQTVFLDQLAIRGNLTTSLASGIDGWSALVVGTSVQAGVGLGAEWSMAFGQSVRLGASLDVDSTPQLNLLVAAAIFNAIKTGGTDPAG